MAIMGVTDAQPSNFFERNRTKLVSQLPSKSIALFVANESMPRNGDEFYPFRQQSDFYYLTGIEEENALLLIAPDYPDESYHDTHDNLETFIPFEPGMVLTLEPGIYIPKETSASELRTICSSQRASLSICVKTFQ